MGFDDGGGCTLLPLRSHCGWRWCGLRHLVAMKTSSIGVSVVPEILRCAPSVAKAAVHLEHGFIDIDDRGRHIVSCKLRMSGGDSGRSQTPCGRLPLLAKGDDVTRRSTSCVCCFHVLARRIGPVDELAQVGPAPILHLAMGQVRSRTPFRPRFLERQGSRRGPCKFGIALGFEFERQ